MKKDLNTYNEKRDFNKTSEPIGKKQKTSNKLRFVVQHHLARKDHYDFRLEYNGALKSWAVPKGPSYDPKDRRLAVMVEDHPLEYRNFEGVIPKGEYGAGPVMIWDEGYYEINSNSKPNFNKGPLKITLYGKRLKGQWSLVKFKDDNWLLIKEKNDIKGFKDITKLNKSIRSNRTMNQIKTGIVKNKIISDDNIEGVDITSPDKIICKNPKITKLDILKYYHKISERMLPLIEGRIISTIRCPSGADGECFFKKHFETKSKGIGKIKLEEKNGEKDDYYYIKNIEGLISEVQMNSYEFHIWGSKVKKLEKPDMMVFDLDPDEGMDLSKIREGVKDLKKILDEFGIEAYLKTSGGKGYHVIAKLERSNWKEFREIAKNIAKLMEIKWPNKYTSNIRKNNRKGKIFIDWVRNTRSSTSVAPYSLRVRKKLTVSMPIKWSELDKVAPDEITMEEAIKRLKRKDPWEGFLN